MQQLGIWETPTATWPNFDDYLSGSGQCADQALRRLTDELRRIKGPMTG